MNTGRHIRIVLAGYLAILTIAFTFVPGCKSYDEYDYPDKNIVIINGCSTKIVNIYFKVEGDNYGKDALGENEVILPSGSKEIRIVADSMEFTFKAVLSDQRSFEEKGIVTLNGTLVITFEEI